MKEHWGLKLEVHSQESNTLFWILLEQLYSKNGPFKDGLI